MADSPSSLRNQDKSLAASRAVKFVKPRTLPHSKLIVSKIYLILSILQAQKNS
jgi:hypothetical protein